MANVTAKTSSNIFYKARCEAATHNEQLSSREGAADYMSIDRGRLYRIESGIAVPYPEEIRLMADLYNAPELENYFCRTMCPLGCEMPKAELANLDRITVRTLSVFRKIGKTKEMLHPHHRQFPQRFPEKRFQQTLIRKMKWTIRHLPQIRQRMMRSQESRRRTGSTRNSRHHHNRSQSRMNRQDIIVTDVGRKSMREYMNTR